MVRADQGWLRPPQAWLRLPQAWLRPQVWLPPQVRLRPQDYHSQRKQLRQRPRTSSEFSFKHPTNQRDQEKVRTNHGEGSWQVSASFVNRCRIRRQMCGRETTQRFRRPARKATGNYRLSSTGNTRGSLRELPRAETSRDWRGIHSLTRNDTRRHSESRRNSRKFPSCCIIPVQKKKIATMITSF